MNRTLGTYKKKYVFSCRGVVSVKEMKAAAKHIVRVAGMTIPHGWQLSWRFPFICWPWEPTVYPYPWRDAGGSGYTLVQPLVESFVIFDVYDELEETEVTLSTCVPEHINLQRLIKAFYVLIGPTKLVGEI